SPLQSLRSLLAWEWPVRWPRRGLIMETPESHRQVLLHRRRARVLGRPVGDDPAFLHDVVVAGRMQREIQELLDQQDRHVAALAPAVGALVGAVVVGAPALVPASMRRNDRRLMDSDICTIPPL